MKWLDRLFKGKSTTELRTELRKREWVAIPLEMAERLYEDDPRRWELYWRAFANGQEETR